MSKHTISYCELCEEIIFICGRCGNNTCNAGYGILEDGTTCPECPDAYKAWDEYYDKIDKVRFGDNQEG